MIYYVYKVTNKNTNEFYIGTKGTELKVSEFFGVKYFTSSTNRDFVKLLKDNPSNFEWEFLYSTRCSEKASKKENDLISESYYLNDFSLNFCKTKYVSQHSEEVIKAMASLIRISRKNSNITESEIAERLGCSRTTFQKVEKGIPTISISYYIESMIILNIPIFESDKEKMKKLNAMLDFVSSLLPKPKSSSKEIKDDF